MPDARTLDQLQTEMAALLRERRALPKSHSAVAFASDEISASARLSPVEQLEIYREQFWLRHTAALLEDFPGLSRVIGQSAWERLSEEYLLALPPSSFSLRELGSQLPEFVAAASWLQPHELCKDMARLEWAYVEAFDAADAELLVPARLAAVPDSAWETARFTLAPSLSLLSASFPVAELRSRLLEDRHESVPLPQACPTFLAVCRRLLNVRTHSLEQPAFVLLHELAGGSALVPAVEATARELSLEVEALAPRLGSWFALWAEQGLIVDVVTARAASYT